MDQLSDSIQVCQGCAKHGADVCAKSVVECFSIMHCVEVHRNFYNPILQIDAAHFHLRAWYACCNCKCFLQPCSEILNERGI